MTGQTNGFYNELADYYHLIFEDWDRSIDRQAQMLSKLLAAHIGRQPIKVLDCACGIGTQALGLAKLGHQVVASDLSPGAVHRARQEAEKRNLHLSFAVSDMTSLAEIPDSDFDLVVAMDNALPHLSPTELEIAAAAIASKLKPNGFFLANIRDYDQLKIQRPAVQGPVFCGAPGNRRIVHQIWDWTSDSTHVIHVYITEQTEEGWQARHFVSEYRCLLREELSAALTHAGFADVRWLMPQESGSYQPLVLARWPAPDPLRKDPPAR